MFFLIIGVILINYNESQKIRTRNMDTYENYLFWVHNYKLFSLNISNPTSPMLLDSIKLDGGGCGIRVKSDGKYAFVGDGHGPVPGKSIKVFNISNPSNINKVAKLEDDDFQNPHGLSLGNSENYLYVTGWKSGYFSVIDVSDPKNPIKTSSVFITEMGPHEVTVTSDERYAFVPDYKGNIASINITNKSNIKILQIFNIGENYGDSQGARITNDDKYIFTGAGKDNLILEPNNLISIDIRNPKNLSVASIGMVPKGYLHPYRLRINEKGDKVFGAGSRPPSTLIHKIARKIGLRDTMANLNILKDPGYIAVWNVSDKENIKLLSHIEINQWTSDIELHNHQNYLYGGSTWKFMLYIADIEDETINKNSNAYFKK